jgi:starch synthase
MPIPTLDQPAVAPGRPPLGQTSISLPAPLRGRRIKRSRILIVTPELNGSNFVGRNGYAAPRAKAGGLADVSSLLFDALAERGADVHVAMPHFRSMFPAEDKSISKRFHFSADREFFYRQLVYEGDSHANMRASLAFQRDVIHHIIPRVKPDLVHCHDWMTALVPAAAKSMGIRSIFTLHNIHDEKAPLAHIEDRGIDAGRFWQHLHYGSYPAGYHECRSWNPVNFLASAIHASDHVTTVSPSFLRELTEGRHAVDHGVVETLRGKLAHGAATGILNALDPGFGPAADPRIAEPYAASTHVEGKAANKRRLQQLLGLEEDPEAPLLFWPSRLDPMQKGCNLLAEILYRLVSDYWALGLQVVFVADGPSRSCFENIARFHGLERRIAVRGFDESLSRQAYAGADYAMVPSAYEPCGLVQMVGLRYGALPIVHRTGGLADTVTHLDARRHTGNGFVFEYHDAAGLRWAIDEAIRFHLLPPHERAAEVARVMMESDEAFSPEPAIGRYLSIYQKLCEKGPVTR